MATVKDLIEQLSKIEDQDQPIIFQYWVAEDFEFNDGSGTPTQEQFAEVADDLYPDTLWEDAREIVNDALYDVVIRDSEEEEDDE